MLQLSPCIWLSLTLPEYRHRFRGSYEDCLAHEKFHGLDVQWQNPDEVRNHLHGLHDEMASLQAEAAELRAELAALESKWGEPTLVCWAVFLIATKSSIVDFI